MAKTEIKTILKPKVKRKKWGAPIDNHDRKE